MAERLKKAKSIAGYTQKTLSEKTGISLSTINELESGHRNMIYLDTLLKLLTVLDKNILCDDYCNFILNQKDNLKNFLDIYGINQLSQKLSIHRSSIERWKNGKYQVSRKYYELLERL
ncbi:UNVERIFIED_ORG: hypothetical protein B2H98_10745 [Clostridium botulinum]